MDFRVTLRSTIAVALLSAAAPLAFAQATSTTESVPAAPAQGTPAPAAPAAPKFPTPNPKNFTAAQPTKEVVDAFLKASWGYDPQRVWQVEAIEKTPAPGISKVVVYVASQQNAQQVATLVFFVTPDGQHLISNDVLPFGAHPYQEARQMLQAQANGPSKGGASKDVELVEFADFQCPHCKEAQPTIARLLTDFPNAHFVFQNYPLEGIHPEAFKAAAFGTCVAKLNGNDAFFKYADATFENQANLTPTGAEQALSDAVTKAGADPSKVAACAATPETKAAVEGSVKLAQSLDVNQTPWLFINGRGLPVNAVPYATLKQIVAYQMQLDK
ncbi:MAG: thioredoxin domain-containing protein [Acidobacteria bacterium]|nr:thioredoxin domain-containing protein [Acidobacteriota bacterium]